jgi:transcriptional regulator with XRE-family HTH domain
MSSVTKDKTSTPQESMGERIASARLARGLSEDQVAKRVGVKLSTFNHWESNRSEPRPSKLQILSGVLNVPVLWLLAGQEMTHTMDYSVSTAETAILTNKLDQLLQLNQQTSKLIFELESEVRRIQREMDNDLI